MWGIIRYVQSFSPQSFVRKPKPILQNFPWLAWEFLAANKTHNHLIFPQQLFSHTFPSLNTQQLTASMGKEIPLFLSFPFHSNHPWLLPFKSPKLSNSIYEISCKRSKTYYSYIFPPLSYTKYIQFGHIRRIQNSVYELYPGK